MIPPVDLLVPVKPLHLAKTRLRADLAATVAARTTGGIGGVGAEHGAPAGGRVGAEHGAPAGGRVGTEHGAPAGGGAGAEHGAPAGGGVGAEHGAPAGGGGGVGTWTDVAHRRLALALVRDTLAAARAADGVRRVLAICSDPAAVAVLLSDGAEVIPDEPDAGLNPALWHGAELLAADDPAAATGALQSDLAALSPGELAAAVAAALASRAARAFCPDRAGTGTTLLLAAPGVALDPRFGPGSARAHAASGALRLDGPWPTLRCDVDTEADLAEATRLGVGPHTAAALADIRP